MKRTLFLSLALLLLISGRQSKSKPYSCGPVLDLAGIQKSFPDIIDFLELKSGDTFADIGASTGYYDVMMSILLENTNIYIEDIDTTCLNRREFDKVIEYYSKLSNLKLSSRNSFHLALGTPDKTNLPDTSFDRIYTNATFHLFSDPDKIMDDLYSKLKPGGKLIIRDAFSNKKKIEYCSDKDCAQPLAKLDTMMAVVVRHGFVLEESRENLRGYPAFRFKKR